LLVQEKTLGNGTTGTTDDAGGDWSSSLLFDIVFSPG
jgi:hypothetical protein